MEEIQKLLEDLSLDNPKDVVDAAISKLLHIDDEEVTLLLQPVNEKCRENAAKVLKIMGYPKIGLALPGIIEWLRDMNWSGRPQIAKEIFCKIDKTDAIPFIEDALRKAAFEEDYIWIATIKELVEEMGFSEEDFTPRTYQLLKFEELLLDIQF